MRSQPARAATEDYAPNAVLRCPLGSDVEADVADLNRVLQQSKAAYSKTAAAYHRNAVALLIFGLLLTGIGAVPAIVSNAYEALFLVPLGCVFLLMSFFSYRSGKQIGAVD
jgi:hypothetical protein